MNSRWVIRNLLRLCAVLSCSAVTFAQPEPANPTAEPDEAAHDPQSSVNDSHEANAEPPLNTLTRRHIAQLTNLLRAMKDQLDLTRQQKAAIDPLFKHHLHVFKETRGRRRPFGEKPEDSEKLQALRQKMMAARKAADQQTAQALREEFRSLLKTRERMPSVTLSQFLRLVETKLDNDQRPAFWALVKRLRMGASPGSGWGDLRPLRRALTRPELKLSAEQHRAIQALLQQGAASIAQARQSGTRTDQITARIRADVVEVLTPLQRTKLEVILKVDDGPEPSEKRVDNADDANPLPREDHKESESNSEKKPR